MPDLTLAKISDTPTSPKISPQSSNPILDEAREFWVRVKGHPVEKAFRTEALTNIKYLTGEDQGWDEDGARSVLESEGRPALTLNRTHPIIRLICGARPRAKVTYIPSEQGKETTAAVLASCKEHVDDDNQWEYKEDEVLLKALVIKRAIVEIRPNYDRDIRGEIDLQLVNSNNVYLDPDSEERDRSDQQRMIVVKNVSREEAIRTFPHKKKDIERFAGYVENGYIPAVDRDISASDGYKDSQSDYYGADTQKLSLIYYWHKTYDKAVKIIDLATGKVADSKLSKEEAEKKLADIGGAERFRVLERSFTHVNYLVFCHDIEFERGTTPWERQDGQRTKLSENFPFIIEELDRIVFGLQQYLIDFMAMLRDPQKYHNKLASSILHIINTAAKGGYDYEEGAISPENLRKLRETGSKPGANIEWDAGAISGAKVRPRGVGSMPQSEMALAESMSRELLDISGVESLISTRSLGKNASGRAIESKQQQGGNIISWVYRSHSFFMHQLSEYVRDAIQAMYDYEKVVRLRGDKPRYMVINQKKYDQQGGIIQILNDVTEGKFATRIREKEEMPTIKMERFRYFSELVKGGALQLPPPVLTKIVLELMDDPDLKEVVNEEMGEFMAQQQKIQAAQAQAGKQIPPAIKENVDIDRLYPLLARSEQVQILQELGIRPDMGARIAGLPDATETLKAGMEGQIADRQFTQQVIQGVGGA